mgnify:CR=1 FL=1
MRSGLTTRFVVIDRSANSLYALIADGRYRALSLGRNNWKSLIGPQASLQKNCNKEGFNVLGGNSHSKARIGIIANQENNCLSCDSRIGFGTGGYPDDSNTCGNEATIHTDNGDKHIKAMGYILVQWFTSNLTFQVKTKQEFCFPYVIVTSRMLVFPYVLLLACYCYFPYVLFPYVLLPVCQGAWAPRHDIFFVKLRIIYSTTTSIRYYTFCCSFRENTQSFALKVRQ